jgi:VWFA-related protein
MLSIAVSRGQRVLWPGFVNYVRSRCTILDVLWGVGRSMTLAILLLCSVSVLGQSTRPAPEPNALSPAIQVQRSPAEKQTTNIPTSGTQEPVPFRLKVTSNLVVVRVMVRDKQGRPVENLKKQDFKLFDGGKQQSIAQFEVQTSLPPPSSAAVVRVPGQAATAPSLATPERFLALYIDDLHSSDADMAQVRDAADRYLAANLGPKDRVAIFTSTTMLSDFTADPKQIHAALSKLQVSSRRAVGSTDCPGLSDYQAQEITKYPNNYNMDAWVMALQEAADRNCFSVVDPLPRDTDRSQQTTRSASVILMRAQSLVAQAEVLARTNLQELGQVVRYIAQMPGQRTIVLVSPGFLSQGEQYQLDRIIDRALRSHVVISSLNPKGLAVLAREADASLSYLPPVGVAHRLDSAREFAATDVLAEVAHGTGGEYFHNKNDLDAGFGALAGPSVTYILAFSPTHIKPNGKFHALKVQLTEKQRDVSIQARRGYFAPTNEAVAEAEAKERNAPDAEAQAQVQIQKAVPSETEVRPKSALGASPSKSDIDVRISLPVEQSLSRPSDEIKIDAAKSYASAHPYMDEPLPELKKVVHELAGLKPASSEEEPSDLLAKVGAKADELLQKVPDLISDEAVSQTQSAASQGMVPGCRGAACLAAERSSRSDRNFNYLILTHRAQDGGLALQEYRTNGNGKPVEQETGAPNFRGFISAWLAFSSVNQVESSFRYLGQQRMDGHNTFVVGFAQIPGSVQSPGVILTDGESVPMFLQGIAWIDQSDFRIVRLRTDLLAPQREISIRRQTAHILFGPVRIATLDVTLWLPQSVHVEMEARGQYFQEQHKYSKYRLYQAKSRITLFPTN